MEAIPTKHTNEVLIAVYCVIIILSVVLLVSAILSVKEWDLLLKLKLSWKSNHLKSIISLLIFQFQLFQFISLSFPIFSSLLNS